MYMKTAWKNLLIVWFATFIPRVLLCINNLPLNAFPDELSTIAAAAQYAGKDWSELISTTRYYGTGFTALFTPLFMITDNPFIIYRCIMIVCAMVQSLSGPICYCIMDKYLEIKNKKYTIISSIACSYMVVTYLVYVFNEHPMILCSWIIALLLILLVKHIDDKKKKGILTLLLGVVLSYSLTLHTRAITYWIAFIVLIVLFFWGYRKWLVSIPVVVCIGGLGYCLSHWYIKFAQKEIWTFNGDKFISMGNKVLEEGQEAYLHNAEITGLQYLKELVSPQSWPSFFNIILSQINTVTVVSVGFAIICIVIIVSLIYNLLIRKESVLTSNDTTNHQMYVVLAIFFATCVAITIGGIAVSWLGQAMRAYSSGMTSTARYGFKAYTHIRYMGPYLGPVMLLGLAYIYQHRDSMKRLIKPCILVFILIQFYYVTSILPYIYRQQVTSTFFVPFSLQEYGKYGDLKRLLTYVPGILITCVLFTIMLVLIYKERLLAIPIILSVILIYEYSYATIFFEDNGYERANSGYTLIKQLEKISSVPDKLYVPNDDTYNTQAYELQFLLNEYKISPYAPNENIAEAIVFYNSYDSSIEKELIKQDYLCAQLDEDEFIYVKGKGLQQAIIDCGINLENHMVFALDMDIRDFKSKNNCALFNHSYLESSCEEGYLLYGNSVNISKGNYRVSIELENLSEDVNIGNMEIWSKDVLLKEKAILEHGDNNEFIITMEGTTKSPKTIEPRLWVNNGIKIKITKCVVESGF